MGNNFVAPYHSKKPLFPKSHTPPHESGRELTISPAGIRDRWPQRWINSVIAPNALRPKPLDIIHPHEFDPVTKKYYWQFRIGAYRHKDEHLERLAQWFRASNPQKLVLTAPPPAPPPPTPAPSPSTSENEESSSSKASDEQPSNETLAAEGEVSPSEPGIKIEGQQWIDVPLYAVLAARLRPHRPLFGSKFVRLTIPILKFTVPSGTWEGKVLRMYYDAANVRALVHLLCPESEFRLAYDVGYFTEPMNYVRTEIEERPISGSLARHPDGSFSFPSLRGIYQGVLFC